MFFIFEILIRSSMKIFIASLSFILFSTIGFSQISSPGTPRGIKNLSIEKNLGRVNFNKLNLEEIQAEDLITDQYKDVAWRFGIVQEKAIKNTVQGTWTEVDGGKIWQVELHAPGALSININYDYFNIPEGSEFFVYGKNTRQVIGAFTSINVKSNLEFATGFVYDETIVLEYFEPYNALFEGVISVQSLVSGYRTLKNNKDFGSSGSCNNNIACFEEWADEGAAVAMLLTSSNSRFCTGALINNVEEDKTPFFLTANHCNPSGNNIFLFDYQSPNCSPNADGNTSKTIVGCTVLAKNAPSDFALVKLSSAPPESYNVSYAGWSAETNAPQSATGIHHPSGDTKKISFMNSPMVDDPENTGTHWRVNDWDEGTTEGGSSGSPIFDQNRRIVGQLQGGWAACGNDDYDTYGAFFYSWDTDPDSTKQLKHWLDPKNTGVKFVDILGGFEPADSIDIATLGINGLPNFNCGENINATISVRNLGISAITSATFVVQLNSNITETINWNETIESGKYGTIAIAEINSSALTQGVNNISVLASEVNNSVDADLNNNTTNTDFKNNSDPIETILTIKFDDYPSESSWSIFDQNDNSIVIPSAGSGNNSQTISIPLCTYQGCFTIRFNDSFGDGICCEEGNGYFMITQGSDTLVYDASFSGSSIIYDFCVFPLGIEETNFNGFGIYPNPSNGMVNIKGLDAQDIQNIAVYDLKGALIAQPKAALQLNLKNLHEGVYFMKIQTTQGSTSSKFVVLP
jgi:lysyl endopeptidase